MKNPSKKTPSSAGVIDDTDRRDFLMLSTGTMAVVGGALAAWPFVDSLNPAADVKSLGDVDVDISNIPPGQGITVKWRGKPVFVRHRTPEEIKEAQAGNKADLPDPQTDAQRVEEKPWIVVIGICTHLGCIPLGERKGEPRGQWGGWFCPCHGSEYDTSGRVRRGPAPLNLAVPPYVFLNPTTIRIGTGPKGGMTKGSGKESGHDQTHPNTSSGQNTSEQNTESENPAKKNLDQKKTGDATPKTDNANMENPKTKNSQASNLQISNFRTPKT